MDAIEREDISVEDAAPMEFFELPEKLEDSVLTYEYNPDDGFPQDFQILGRRRRTNPVRINRQSDFITWLESNVNMNDVSVKWFEGKPIFFFHNPSDALKCILKWAE